MLHSINLYLIKRQVVSLAGVNPLKLVDTKLGILFYDIRFHQSDSIRFHNFQMFFVVKGGSLGPEDLYVMTCIAVVDQLNDLGDSAPMQAPVHTDVIPVEALPNTAVNAFIDAYTESK